MYKVSFQPNIDDEEIYENVYDTKKEAEVVLNAISAYTLSLHDAQLMYDYSNLGWIDELIDSSWVTIDD